jgi:hypothetical protein
VKLKVKRLNTDMLNASPLGEMLQKRLVATQRRGIENYERYLRDVCGTSSALTHTTVLAARHAIASSYAQVRMANTHTQLSGVCHLCICVLRGVLAATTSSSAHSVIAILKRRSEVASRLCSHRCTRSRSRMTS